MTATPTRTARSLAQTLAIQSQIHLPGTAGRIIRQIRDIERIAPMFAEAGLVRVVERPRPLNIRVAGISTHSTTTKVMGGHLYASAAVRVDLAITDNIVATSGNDSTCELDDIDYEDQSKHLQLIGVKQAYEMAHAALSSGQRYDVILLDCPLLLNRSMVPAGDLAEQVSYVKAFEAANRAISQFWSTHRSALLPWNSSGTAVVGLASERFGAIVHIAQQDLRTELGRQQILSTEQILPNAMDGFTGAETAIAGVGERRFIHGILGSYTRTAAFKMNVQTPRMEPTDVVQLGVAGFHFRAGHRTMPRLVQLIGDSPEWTQQLLDKICGEIMALIAVGGAQATPLPILLAEREQSALRQFVKHYARSVQNEIKVKGIEDLWLSDLEDAGMEKQR